MTLTNTEIINLYLALQTVVNTESTLVLPGKLGYTLLKNYSLLETEVNAIEQERLQIITDHHGVQEESDGPYQIPEEEREIANKELTELSQKTKDIAIKTVPSSILDTVELPISIIHTLYFMLDDSERA